MRAERWQAWIVTGCLSLTAGVGCISPLSLGETLKLEPMVQPAASVEKVELVGRCKLDQLRDLLWTAYRIELSLPLEIADREVLLPGALTKAELVAWLERAAECEVITVADYWSVVCEGSRFVVIVPPVAFSTIGSVKIENVGGRGVATGDYEELPRLRRLLQLLEKPREAVRLRIILVDESKATQLSGAFSVPFKVAYDRGFMTEFKTDLVVSAFRRGGLVVNEFDGLVTDGEKFEYKDQTEQRFQQFVASGDSGQTFRSEFETLSAGLSVELRAVRLSRMWRLEGLIELSDFRAGAGVPDRVSRTVKVNIDAAAGSVLRLATVRVDRAGRGGGIEGNVPLASWDKSGSVFGIWLLVEQMTATVEGPSDVVLAVPAE